MWLPTPLYESLPYAYVVIGVLFVSGTVYTGPGPWSTILYGASAVISIMAGICIYARRRKLRASKEEQSD